MLFTFLGYRPLDFVDKKTGERIIGTQLFVTAPFDSIAKLHGAVGYEPDKYFLDPDMFDLFLADQPEGFALKPGDHLDLDLNRKNHCIGLRFVEHSDKLI